MEDFYADALKQDARWLRDPELVREYMRLFGEMQGSRRLLRRLLRENGEGSPAAQSTVVYVKLINTVLKKNVGLFMLKAQGLDGQLDRPGLDETMSDPYFVYITAFGGTIAGGSNEIMRNILSERVLGMPRL
jgi:alkylation response protein AidB-like acyl-CoA dehydrogenase